MNSACLFLLFSYVLWLLQIYDIESFHIDIKYVSLDTVGSVVRVSASSRSFCGSVSK